MTIDERGTGRSMVERMPGLMKSRLKNRFRKCLPTFGAWMSLGHPSIAEIFASSGVHFVGIDLEHTTISLSEAQRIIAASQAAGVPCLARAASVTDPQIPKFLDSGADGLIVPNVSTAGEVRRIIALSHYPPVGRRGYGVARAQGYGFDFESYTAGWNKRFVLLIQIETIEGVENVEKLLSYDEVDAVMIGPYDISGSLGIPGKLTHRRVTQACRRVIAMCRKYKKSCGTQIVEPDGKNVSAALRMGYSFVVLASDIFILWRWGEKMQRLTRGLSVGR